MASKVHSVHLVCLTIILTVLHNSLAWRNYFLVLTDVKCILNPEIGYASCNIDNTQFNPSLNIDCHIVKEVTDLRLDISIDLDRPNNESFPLYKQNNLNGCDLLTTNVTQPIIKMLKDMLVKFGTFPKKCPVEANYHYKFVNLTLDAEYLPAFVPETDFRIDIHLKERKTTFWIVNMHGSIVNKKQFTRRKNKQTDVGNQHFI